MFDNAPPQPQPHPSAPRRHEGFHIPPSNIPKSSHNHSLSPAITTSPQMLLAPFGHMASFTSQSLPGSSHYSDEDLWDPLPIPSNQQYALPTVASDPAPQPAFQLPYRNLPRHLDSASPAPSSPNNDLYSPGSGSSVSGTADLFAEHHYGSFAHDSESHQQRAGRPNGRAPAPRSRSARRPSASIRTSILSRAIPCSDPQAPERPMAISVPTYLSAHDWQPNEGAKVSFQLGHSSNGFVGSCSPSDSILSSLANHQTPATMGGSLGIPEDVSSLVGSPVFGTRSVEGAGQEQESHAVLSEKRRRRRESHNAVERRRRENINERIQDLCKLLPAVMLTESGPGTVDEEEGAGGGGGGGEATNGNNNNKHNKGFILAKSVDYIKHLKDLVDHQAQENVQLKQALQSARQQLEPSSFMNTLYTQPPQTQHELDHTSLIEHHLALWASQERVGVGVGDPGFMSVDHQ